MGELRFEYEFSDFVLFIKNVSMQLNAMQLKDMLWNVLTIINIDQYDFHIINILFSILSWPRCQSIALIVIDS